MINKEFIVALSRETGLTQEETQQRVNDLLQVMEKIWQDNDSVSVSGFGVLSVKKRAERISINPKTGQRMLIPPRLSLSYRPSTMLKDKVK
ncbi:MAG TPA: HU family DNA-binding protein [Bacteroidaceae bacterium]|nr:HU family DNA-binding protein [Bacteroidaceae bacterium]